MTYPIKTFFALLITAWASPSVAQELAPISEAQIGANDFGGIVDLPVNPLPEAPQRAIAGSATKSIGQPTPAAPAAVSATPTAPALQNTVPKPPVLSSGSSSRRSATSTTQPSATTPQEATAGDTVNSDNYDDNVYNDVIASEPYEVQSILGLSTLGFRRNNGEALLLSTNDAGSTLNTADADHNDIGGFEVYLGVRASTGVGWEFRYFGFEPSENTVALGDNPNTVLLGLSDIAQPGFPSVATIFNTANQHTLTRNTGIYNFEFNFLRNRPVTDGWFKDILQHSESIIGFRYIDFDESLVFGAQSDTGPGPRLVEIDTEVENQLWGIQGGRKSEFHLYKRWGGTLGLKFGFFYTRASANRRISGSFANGAGFSPSIAGSGINGFDFSSSENDVSFLAEIDLGLIYQLGQTSRIRFGYRAIGISGLAFASNNIPLDFANVAELQETNDSQDLRLRGGYLTYELAF